eukprot:2454320-Rhodomonas_salina.1
MLGTNFPEHEPSQAGLSCTTTRVRNYYGGRTMWPLTIANSDRARDPLKTERGPARDRTEMS